MGRGEAPRGQGGPEGVEQQGCAGPEEGREGHLRAEATFGCFGSHLRGQEVARTEVVKKVWVYIKKNSLNEGRIIKPDAKLKAVFPVASLDMLKLAGHISKHS